MVIQFLFYPIFLLPRFISENNIDWYKNFALKVHKQGDTRFLISHFSQLNLLPQKSTIACNERVYVYNDATAKALETKNIRLFTFPVENDFENLLAGSNHGYIVPVYATPELFYSRMPIKN